MPFPNASNPFLLFASGPITISRPSHRKWFSLMERALPASICLTHCEPETTLYCSFKCIIASHYNYCAREL